MGTFRCPECPHCTGDGNRRQSQARVMTNAATNTDNPACTVNHGRSNRNTFVCVVIVVMLGFAMSNVALLTKVFSLTSEAHKTAEEKATMKWTNEMLEQQNAELVRINRKQRQERHEFSHQLLRLHQDKVDLEVQNEDLGLENDNLRIDVDDVTETLQYLEMQNVDLGSENDNLRLEVENMTETVQYLEIQNEDLGMENNNLRWKVENVTETVQMMERILKELINFHEHEVERIRIEGAKQLEQVRHDSKMSIEEKEKRIRRVELELQRMTEEVIVLKIEQRLALSELEQCKSSAEAWSTAAKVAGGAAIMLGTYATPYVGAALKFASFV